MGLALKFTFEVITTKLFHQMNPHFWQVVAKSCGIKIVYTPVHLIESVENCGLCMRRYLACSSYVNVMYQELAITHPLHYDASVSDYAQSQPIVSSTLMHRF